ncbi:MAG: hypothetical protein EBR28_11710 [Planctomycetia bacterium]|nr:hypothetical protein [Planctomycetia bacterium]
MGPIDELANDRGDDRPAPRGEHGDRPLDDEGRPRRRRRRRGRRGGRRGESGAERPAGEAGGEGRLPRSGTSDEPDEEPLPAGYGRAPAARQPEQRDSAGGAEGGERRGRRRRRGRGDDSGRRSGGETAGDGSKRRGRRGRRNSDGERTSSSSSLARRSRDDFAPVSRGYDEDDEGLEFLGVEEASREQHARRERHPEDDDVIVESGLSAVRDVPSWVEAIGIVIAGNLDARSRPRSERADDDRRRR